jgi:hypothetical protein
MTALADTVGVPAVKMLHQNCLESGWNGLVLYRFTLVNGGHLSREGSDFGSTREGHDFEEGNSW